MRGRKPLSRELLELRGTNRPDRERPPSTILEPIKVDEIRQRCQISGLRSATERARKIYWATVKRVALLEMLDEAYLSQLLFYAVEYDHFMTCTESVKKEGAYLTVKGKEGQPIVVPNPSVKMRDNALEKLLKIGSNFGLSPVDRQRVKIHAEKPKQSLQGFIAAIIADEADGPDEQ